MENGFLDLEAFDMEEYEHYEVNNLLLNFYYSVTLSLLLLLEVSAYSVP